MAGTNVLLLNKATMIKATEYYLCNVQFKEPVKVSDVEEDRNEHQFKVTFNELTEDKEG